MELFSTAKVRNALRQIPKLPVEQITSGVAGLINCLFNVVIGPNF
jgi:hypothetical protein